jgi:hypothetical protein
MCQVWGRIRRSKSWAKSAPPQRPFRDLASGVGACLGDDQTAGISRRHRSSKGNHHMRRILNQAAQAAVK